MRTSRGLFFLLLILALVGCDGETAQQSSDTTLADGSTDGTQQDGGSDGTTGDAVADGDTGSDVIEPTCEDECSAGSQTCNSDGDYVVCGQYDADPCLEPSPPIICASGYVCDGGACIPPCRSECPVGETICGSETEVQVCGNFDTDACLEPGGASACGTDERCEAGACVPTSQACTDECSTGDSVCFGDATRACGDFDSDSCLDLGPPVACALGETCSDGACVEFCVDECPEKGATDCVGDGVRTCGDTDTDACLEWGSASPCPAGESCSNGLCSNDCADECENPGGSTCSSDGSGVSFCGDYDSDTCNDLASPVPCPLGFACQSGLCVASCTNDCTPGDAARCGSDGSSIETCGDFDGDPCFEWGGATSCPGGAACSGGACDIPCSDECTTSGEAECNANGDGFQTCGQFDLDACLEWSGETLCQSFESCDTGACVLGQTPAILLINELLVDSTGTDSAQGNLLFIELWGPAGTSLDGWSVVGLNGDGGSDYNVINLDGEVLANDGYFVIAHPNAAAELAALADITDSNVDFQNGPDSVQLRWRTRTVDAVAYGNFTSGTVFGGEGSAVASAGPGESLSRDDSHTDTNDNSADFASVVLPTPREGSASCVDDCTTGDTRCDSNQVQTCGDYDSDDCLEWSASADCPTSGETCQAGSCQPPCSDECPSQGATLCTGTQIQTCGNTDGDACLEWSAAADCPTDQICVVDTCQSKNAPEVVLIAPQGTLQTTQGNTHRILADATPAAGRSITEVRYYADGQLLGTTTQTPHEYFYTIPASAPTDSTITIQAHAEDDAGETGVSQYAWLDVKNDVPVAAFTASITNAQEATFDATASSDTETSDANLEVCWDWDNDGTCDTTFDTQKLVSHDFGTCSTSSCSYTVRMVARDEVGQTDETTREVTFASIQYLGGTDITTTTWYGNIIVTGDLTVPAGETLTIAAGTSVLFVNSDVNGDGVGDYTITVNGALVVEGTASEPVIFSGQDTNAKVPGGWDRIILAGAGSSIDHAVIEYADVGLEVRNDATVSNTSVRLSKSHCIYLNNGDNASFTDVSVSECGGSGVYATSSTGVTFTGLSSTSNGEDGVHATTNSGLVLKDASLSDNSHSGLYAGTGTTVDMSDSVSETNLDAGVVYADSSAGTVTQNEIRQNGAAGVRLLDSIDTNRNPNPVIQLNNIHSNATTGSLASQRLDPSGTLSASYGCCSTTGTRSAAWSAPAGTEVRRVRITYSEYYSSASITGYLENGADDSTIRSFTSNFSGWVEVPPGITSLKVRVRDTGRSGTTDTIIATDVEVVSKDGTADVVQLTTSGKVDMRYNYLGTFPNVLTRVHMTRPAAGLNIQGFVGILFDSNWDRGPYKGGGDSPTESWSGTIYITGDLNIPAGETVSVSAGTEILFVDVDENSDGAGDYGITARGSFDLAGSTGTEITLSGYGTPSGDVFQHITLVGTSTDASTWNDVEVRYGKTPITITGSPVLTRVMVYGESGDGIIISGGTGAQLTDVTVDGAGRDGFHITSATSSVLSGISSLNSGRHGIYIGQSATPTIEDSTIRSSADDGVHVDAATPILNYNIISLNGGNGLHFETSGSGSAEYNVIKFNKDSGVSVWESITGGSNPTPTVQYSNIFGNATDGTTLVSSYDPSGTLSASYGCCSTTGTRSAAWSAPAGTEVRRVRITYSEYYSSASITGYLENGADDSTIRSFTSNFSGWVEVPPGITSLKVRVRDTGRSGTTDTIIATDVEVTEFDTSSNYELTAYTTSGVTTAKFNYWTPNIGEVPQKIYETRSGSVDYQGATGIEYSGAQAGPRP